MASPQYRVFNLPRPTTLTPTAKIALSKEEAKRLVRQLQAWVDEPDPDPLEGWMYCLDASGRPWMRNTDNLWYLIGKENWGGKTSSSLSGTFGPLTALVEGNSYV